MEGKDFLLTPSSETHMIKLVKCIYKLKPMKEGKIRPFNY